jgi:hypothetical protein
MVVVDDGLASLETKAANHLKHHGINATLVRTKRQDGRSNSDRAGQTPRVEPDRHGQLWTFAPTGMAPRRCDVPASARGCRCCSHTRSVDRIPAFDYDHRQGDGYPATLI